MKRSVLVEKVLFVLSCEKITLKLVLLVFQKSFGNLIIIQLGMKELQIGSYFLELQFVAKKASFTKIEK